MIKSSDYSYITSEDMLNIIEGHISMHMSTISILEDVKSTITDTRSLSALKYRILNINNKIKILNKQKESI